ncbi:MAG TPA: MbcA/ParS/Xre antitoxin family protein [Gammaproteobacteria bacterium]|nr:MbcA/ParS/Xre antitoxin family protein [Gammaproteobacteria bacterium]
MKLQKSVDANFVLNKALVKASQYIGLTQREVSAIVGSSPAQISRLFKYATPCIHKDTKEGECALLFLRLIRSLEALVGEDPKEAHTWLYSYNHHLRGIPIDLIKTIVGLHEVVLYLDAMRG